MSTAIPEIPPIESFPPINVYPGEAEIIKYCNDYVAEHFPFNNDAEVKHFNGMEIPAYACRVVSFARDHEKMRKVSILIVFYFIFDDWVDKNGMKLDKNTVMALLPPPSEVPIKPPQAGKMTLADISAELYGAVRDDMPKADYDGMVNDMMEYLRVQRMAPGYNTLQELLDLRSGEVGVYVLFRYIIYAMELSVSGKELDDPLVKRAQVLGSEAGVLRNEASSYVKEVNEGSGAHNVITKLQEWSGCTEKEAMKQVLDAIEKRQEELREMCLKVMEAPHLSEDCKTFVKTIPYIVAGNTWWHHHSTRYAEGREVTVP